MEAVECYFLYRQRSGKNLIRQGPPPATDLPTPVCSAFPLNICRADANLRIMLTYVTLLNGNVCDRHHYLD
jgi:hypothetical protein